MTSSDAKPVEAYLTIKADGFRSLRKVYFTLHHGLNVLAGPNGSGKTNVVALLDFMSEFISKGTHSAIAKLGGAARIFSNEDLANEKKKYAKLSVSINGVCPFTRRPSLSSEESDDSEDVESGNPERAEFAYHLQLSLDKREFSVSVQHEELRWKISDKPEKFLLYRAPNVAQVSDGLQSEILSALGSILSKSFIETMQKHYESDPIESQIKYGSKEGRSIISSVNLPPESGGSAVKSALAFERSFNIDPSKVRNPEDIASAMSLGADGSGVITHLYELAPKSLRAKKAKKSDYNRIVQQFSEINDNIKGLEVVPDLKTGRLKASVTVCGSMSDISIPLESVSDGTAKWLAMLVIIGNSKNGYCVEEPENYLHPQAQRLFLNAIRGSVKDNDSKIFLVTTHSETIINNSKASELLISEYKDGGTRIRRIRDSESVERAINKTGFGLGFLYANDRL
jgi:predicted ATPase